MNDRWACPNACRVLGTRVIYGTPVRVLHKSGCCSVRTSVRMFMDMCGCPRVCSSVRGLTPNLGNKHTLGRPHTSSNVRTDIRTEQHPDQSGTSGVEVPRRGYHRSRGHPRHSNACMHDSLFVCRNHCSPHENKAPLLYDFRVSNVGNLLACGAKHYSLHKQALTALTCTPPERDNRPIGACEAQSLQEAEA